MMIRSLFLLLMITACGGAATPDPAAQKTDKPTTPAPAVQKTDKAPSKPPKDAAPSEPPAPKVVGTPGLVPADSDRLKGYVAIERGLAPTDFEGFLAEHKIPLLERSSANTLDGNEPPPDSEHPSKKNIFRIGPITPVEAWWIFATYDGSDWFPTPDSATLPWKPGEDAGTQVATAENPGKESYVWTDKLKVVRDETTQRVTNLSRYIRSEGGGTSRFMKRLDDTTWELRDVRFAD